MKKRIISLALAGLFAQSMMANDWPAYLQEPIKNFKKVNHEISEEIYKSSKSASNLTLIVSMLAGIGFAFWINKFPENASKQRVLGIVGGFLVGLPFSGLTFSCVAKTTFKKNLPAINNNVQKLLSFCKTDQEKERVEQMIKQRFGIAV